MMIDDMMPVTASFIILDVSVTSCLSWACIIDDSALTNRSRHLNDLENGYDQVIIILQLCAGFWMMSGCIQVLVWSYSKTRAVVCPNYPQPHSRFSLPCSFDPVLSLVDLFPRPVVHIALATFTFLLWQHIILGAFCNS